MSPQPYIACPKCGMVSHNPNDVRERYCGNCHGFHIDLLKPGYWMNETGGELVPAMHRYLKGEALTLRDVALIGAYIRQWIESPVWEQNPRMDDEGRECLAALRVTAAARFLTNRKAIDAWIAMAEDFGVDPL